MSKDSKVIFDYEYEIKWGRDRFHIIAGDRDMVKKIELVMHEYFGFTPQYCGYDIIGVIPIT